MATKGAAACQRSEQDYRGESFDWPCVPVSDMWSFKKFERPHIADKVPMASQKFQSTVPPWRTMVVPWQCRTFSWLTLAALGNLSGIGDAGSR